LSIANVHVEFQAFVSIYGDEVPINLALRAALLRSWAFLVPHADFPGAGYLGVAGRVALGSLDGWRSPLLVEKVRSAWCLRKLMGLGSSALLHACSAKMDTELSGRRKGPGHLCGVRSSF